MNDEEYTLELLVELFHTGLRCKGIHSVDLEFAFSNFATALTLNQIRKLTELGEANGLPLPQMEVCHSSETSQAAGPGSPSLAFISASVDNAVSPSTQPSQKHQPVFSHADGSLDELAKEFGVDTHVVQALAQRLAKLC